jgi:hypothetical protein
MKGVTMTNRRERASKRRRHREERRQLLADPIRLAEEVYELCEQGKLSTAKARINFWRKRAA